MCQWLEIWCESEWLTPRQWLSRWSWDDGSVLRKGRVEWLKSRQYLLRDQCKRRGSGQDRVCLHSRTFSLFLLLKSMYDPLESVQIIIKYRVSIDDWIEKGKFLLLLWFVHFEEKGMVLIVTSAWMDENYTREERILLDYWLIFLSPLK